jgi:hypothetical protein
LCHHDSPIDAYLSVAYRFANAHFDASVDLDTHMDCIPNGNFWSGLCTATIQQHI